MATQFNFNSSPFSFSDSSGPSNPFLEEVPILGLQDFETPSFGQDEFLGGLGIGGAAFAAQTGRLPTPVPSGNLSPFAQRVAANDAARNAAARSAAARSAAASVLPRFAGPGAALLGLVDLGSRAFTGKGIGELGGELIGNVIYPGAQSLPPVFDAGTLEELAAEGGVPFNPYEFRQDNFSGPVSLNSNTFGGFSLPNSFRPPSAGAIPNEEDPFINPITLQSLGLESGPQEVLRTGQLPVPEEVIDELSSASNQNLEGLEPSEQSILDILNIPSPEQAGQDFINQGRRSSDMPLSVDETRALLQERFGAPTISAIQALPAGEGLGLSVDPQGRMISPSPEDDRSAFDQASTDRQDRINLQDFLPGETAVQRDTRLANAKTAGSDNVPLDVIEAINTPSNRRTKDQIKRISQWESSEQGKAMGGVSGLVQERTQFEPRVVEVEGQRLIQLAPNYYQPIRSEPKAEEVFEPRVTEHEGFVYYEIAPNRFERQPSSNFTSPADLKAKLSQLGVELNAEDVTASAQSNFQVGEVREQDGIRYQFDGTNWNQL